MAPVLTELDVDMDMGMDEIWNETLQNFQHCTNEEETPSLPLSPAPPRSTPALDDEDIDIDAIWRATMENFQQCSNRDSRLPMGMSPVPSSPVLASQVSIHTPSSPSSLSYVPSPPRKSHRQHMEEIATIEHGEDDEEDDSWEHHDDLGLALYFLLSNLEI
jgi:hypothetical protein